ncbi:MAG: trypsin-like peptidase domain-containing protein [Candidatus Nealsonbacteria bacterium]|nr:trypsin-like peptidase domain-containing protein [Candidatus Nealsonbacteria bacterium]
MRIKITVVILLIAIILPVAVSGQADFSLPKPGLTPDSPFYFFDTLGERLNLLLTFSPEKKAEKAIRLAEEKLAEVRVMAEKNKTTALASANQGYQNLLELANQKTQEAKEKGKDVEELAILITEKTLKHQEVLIEVFEKVPEEAKTAIQNAIEVSRKGSETAVEAVSGTKKEELSQKIEEMRTTVEVKINALEGRIKSLEERLEEKATQAETDVERLKREAETATGEAEKARLLAEVEKAKLEAEKARAETERAKAEAEKLKKEIEEAKNVAAEETVPLSITSVSPNQILNNIENPIIINGFGIQKGAEVIIGNISFGIGNVIDSKTIVIKVYPGVLYPGSYNVQVKNPDGKTDILHSVLTIVKPQPSTPAVLSSEEITARVSPAVILIWNNIKQGSGSGIIVDSSGYALTNEHVINGDTVVDVITSSGIVTSAQVIGWNEVYDLAVIKLSGNNFEFASFGNSDEVNLGEEALAFGYPKIFSLGAKTITVTKGIISARNTLNGLPYFQTDASIHPGNSGGPLVNKDAQVIGINTYGVTIESAIGSVGVGINFSLEINVAKSILSDLKAGARVSITPPVTETIPGPTSPPPSPGILRVSLASDNPSSQTFVKGSVARLFSAFQFSTDSAEPIRVTKLRFKINNGSGTAADVSNVTLWDGSTKVGGPVGVIGSYATFGINTVGYDTVGLFDIPAASTKTIYVKADIPTGATTNRTVDFDIALVSDTWADGIGSRNDLPSGNIILVSGNADTHSISAGSLTASVASTPVDQTRIIGETDIPFVGIVFNADVAEDVRITRVKLTVSSSGEASASDISNIALYDGATRLTSKNNLTATVSGVRHTVEFVSSDFLNSLGINITKGQQKTITVKADIPSTAVVGHKIALGISSNNDISTTGLISNSHIEETLVATGINYDDTNLAANLYEVELLASGSISVTTASEIPTTRIIAVGSEGSTTFVNLGLIMANFTASGEDIYIKQIVIQRVAGYGSDANFASIGLWDGSTQLGSVQSLTNGSTIFNLSAGSYWRIPKGITKTLAVKATFNGIGSGSVTGDTTKLILASFDAEGVSSGNDNLFGEGAVNISGNTQILRKSKPTLAAASLPSTTLTTGEKVLYRWTVSADSAGAIGWKRVVFNITGTLAGNTIGATSTVTTATTGNTYRDGVYTVTSGTGTGLTKSINQFKVWDVTNNQQVTAIATDANGYNLSTNSVGAIIRVDSDASAGSNVIFVAESEQQVAAGTSRTYELRGNIVRAPSAGDALLTRIADLGSSSLSNSYPSVATAAGGDISLVDPSVTIGASFIWSDRSTTNHSESTSDWINDYKVDGLPVATLSLSK